MACLNGIDNSRNTSSLAPAKELRSVLALRPDPCELSVKDRSGRHHGGAFHRVRPCGVSMEMIFRVALSDAFFPQEGLLPG